MFRPRKPYKYTPLKSLFSSGDAIRLIHLKPSVDCESDLRCKILKNSLSHSPSFLALSYTWGEPVFPCKILVDDDSVIAITENLDLALRRIRLEFTKPVKIWVDAVCINQQDSEERDHQVRLMSQIYSKAEVVIAWVGDDTDTGAGSRCLVRLWQIASASNVIEGQMTPELRSRASTQEWPGTFEPLSSTIFNNYRRRLHMGNHDKLSRIGAAQGDVGSGIPPSLSADTYLRSLVLAITPDDYYMVRDFLSRPYFSRRWIVQELYLAAKASPSNVVICCGETILAGFTVAQALRQMLVSSLSLQLAKVPDIEPLIKPLLRMMNGAYHRMMNGAYQTPVSWMEDFLHFQCSDERDHVFSQLAVFERLAMPLALVSSRFENISYRSPISKIYSAVAEFQLDFQPLEYYSVAQLLALSGALASQSRGPGPLPSWVPDWRQQPKFLIPPFNSDIGRFEDLAFCKPRKTYVERTGGAPDPKDPNQPFLERRFDTTYAASTHPSTSACLRVWGVSFDTITHTVMSNPSTPERIRLLWDGIAEWECSHYYRSVCGSVRRAVSAAVVCHSFKCEEDPPDYYAQVRWEQNVVLEQIESKRDVYELNNFGERLSQTMRGRSVVYTRKGFIGVAGCESKPGDTIVAVVGGGRPFVFRKPDHCRPGRRNTTAIATVIKQEACYELVSDAYLHGFDMTFGGLGLPGQMFLF